MIQIINIFFDQNLEQIIIKQILSTREGCVGEAIFISLNYFIFYLIIISQIEMSKEQESNYLKYGQGILIKGYKSQSNLGFLTAKGFADIRARYQTYDDILYFKNYRNAIFKILPAGSFEINDELQYYYENNFQSNEGNISILKSKAKSEKLQFDLTVESKNKNYVCFGDQIILQHIDSETYLSGTIKPSDGTNGAFNVELTKNLSTSLIFKFHPYRSFESISSRIPIDSPVLIQNIYNQGFLTYQRIGIKKKQKNLHLDKSPIKSDDSYKIAVKTESTNSEIYECVTHFSDLSLNDNEKGEQLQEKVVPMPWGFQLHFNDADNDCLIQHDIVYFQHTQNGGVLAAQGEQQIILKQIKGQKSLQLQIYDCLWELQTYLEKGTHSYILRHLISGMTFGVQYLKGADGSKTPLRPKLMDISDGKGDGSIQNLGYLELRLAKKQGGIIGSKSYINLCSGQMCLDIAKQRQTKTKRQNENKMLYENQQTKVEDKNNLIDMELMMDMIVKEFNFEVKKVAFTMDISKHCFIIQQISDNLKQQVLFALSFHSRLIQLRQDLKWGAEESEKNISYLKMMQITQKIKQIKDFLKNCDFDDPNKQFMRPLPKRQRICFDLGISELLFELLFFLNKNRHGFINSQGKLVQKGPKIFETKPNQRQKFNEMYNAIYEVIFELIKDNDQFKIHVNKWIMFIVEDIIENNEEYQLKTLLQLLKENSLFINNFVTDNFVQFLANKMIRTQSSHQFNEIKYIQVFRAFCICGKQVNSGNQVLILNNFIKKLKPQDNGFKYRIELGKKKNENGKQEIVCEAAVDKNVSKWRLFDDYYKICKEQYPSAWSYFVSYLNLIADMVQGRNKIVENYIQVMITADVLSELMTQEVHQAEVPIIRMMHYLYVESERFYPIQKINQINHYGLVGEKALRINQVAEDSVRPKDMLGDVMQTLLLKLNKYGSIRVEEVAKNECLFVTLDFVRQTISLGFWETKDEIKYILSKILQILTPPKDINYEEISKQSQKPQVILMTKCKEKCMQILQLILNYDMDYTLQICNRTFKQFQLPTMKKSVQVDTMFETSVESSFALDFIKQQDQNQAKQAPLIGPQVCEYMIELAKHNHPVLTSFSLKILQRILQYSQNRIHQFYHQIYICEEERFKLSEFVRERKNKFFTLEYQNTTKINFNNQKSLYFTMHNDDNKSAGIMQDLYMITQLMKHESKMVDWKANRIKTLDSSRTFRQLATQKLVNFTSERRSSDSMKQKVVTASNIHLKVLTYIFNCKQIPTDDLAFKLLHLSYRYMVSIIENNQQMKVQLVDHIPKIINHLKKNIGCIDFLKQMYDNNRNMLYNENQIIRLIKNVCDTIQLEPTTMSFYKSKLLDFFRYLIYCNGKTLNTNQIQIMKIMQDDSYKTIILEVDPSRVSQLVQKYEEMNKNQGEDDNKTMVKMEPQLVYMITFFQIMVSLIDGRCIVNIGKLLKKFPFETLIDCIKRAKTCWPLKRNIRAFLNRLYYLEPQIETYMNIIIKEQIDNIISDFNQYILVKSKSTVQEFEAKYFENPVRFSYLESYLYLNLEQNLFTLHELVDRNPDKKLLAELKASLHSVRNQKSFDGQYSFIKICERLGWIRNYFSENKNIFSTSFIKFLLHNLKSIIEEFDDNVYTRGMTFSGDRVPTKQQKDRERKVVINKILGGQITTYFVQESDLIKDIIPLSYITQSKLMMPVDEKVPNRDRLIKKLRQILSRTKRQFESEDQSISYKHQKLVVALKLSDDVKERCRQDYNKRLSNYAGTQSLYSYIQSIIQINSSNPDAFSPSLKIFFLNKIIGSLKKANKTKFQKAKQIDEWEAEDWEQSSEQISNMQYKLKICKVGQLIAQLLKQNILDNIPLANTIFLCGIAFMLGGNEVTQKNMKEEIDQDVDGKVFKNINNLIGKLGKLILKNIDEGSYTPTITDKFETNTIDNYDFYDEKQKFCERKNVIEPNSTDQVIYHKDCITTYRRAFKFLQLLCQNGNTQNKHYIRQQPDKMNSINFITTATNELRNLFVVMNKQIINVPQFLLDFLNEVTQIPVKLNQDALMNSSFFEDLCQMDNEFSKPQKLVKRCFDEGKYPFDSIMGKSIQIILSNFEGNDKNIFGTLDSKVDPKFLVNIIDSKLNEIGVKSKSQLLKYMEKTIFHEDQNGEVTVNTKFSDEIMGILDILVIFFQLQEKLKDQSRLCNSYKKYKESNLNKGQIFNYLESLLIHIQITNQNNQRQLIYFPKVPVFNSLSGSLRDFIMGSVKRQTHRDKIVSLIGYTSSVKENIQYAYKMEQLHQVTEQNLNNSYYYASVMSIVICVFMMLYYDVIVQYHQADFTSSRLIRLARLALSLVQLSMSIVFAYYWYILKIWQKSKYKPVEKASEEVSEETVAVVTGSESKKLFYEFLSSLKEGLTTNQKDDTIVKFLRVLLFLSASFFGTFFHPPLIFIHLIDIVCNSPILASIFQAIAKSLQGLAYVSLMGVVFVAIFCTVTFSNYMKNVYEDVEEDMCDDMLTCIIALYLSGAIGQTMQKFEITRFAYDMVYFIFFGLLFGNIVSGIILDAFAKLRQDTGFLDDDKKNKCYICNKGRQKIEKERDSFQNHTNDKHFLWNYVFYIISLSEKSTTDYTGLQYYISQQYNRPDEEMEVTWIPDGEEVEFDQQVQIRKIISAAQKLKGEIDESLGHLQQKRDQFNALAGQLEG